MTTRSKRAPAAPFVVRLASLALGALAACGGGEEAAAPVGPVDSGFRPSANGFSFANFGGESEVAELGALELRRMFGDVVCQSIDGDTCKLTALAKVWAKDVNKSMKGGRCEGFAVLSQILFTDLEDATTFGGAEAYALSLDGNDKLGHEIAYWFATQNLQDVMSKTTVAVDGNEALSFLARAFSKKDDIYRMGITRVDEQGRLTGGHAITPYAIVEGDAEGQMKILVYDNNHPGEERAVVVDTIANRWEYSASSNPDEEGSLYVGEPSNKNPIYFAPTKPRFGVHRCPFCEGEGQDVDGASQFGSAATGPRDRELRPSGGVEVVAEDPYGFKVGLQDGVPIADMPGSKIVPTFSDSLFADDAPPMILVPQGPDVAVGIDASGASEPSSVSLYGPGAVAGAEEIPIGRDGDALVVAGDGASMGYVSSGGDTPPMILGVDQGGGEVVLVRADTQGQPGGETVTLGVGPTGNVTVELDGEKTEIQIEVTIETGDGEPEVFAAVLETSGEDSLTLKVDEWAGGDAPMPVDVDTDGDGDIDESGPVESCGAACDFGTGDDDGVAQAVDNCPDVANADQADADGNGVGDACSSDDDADGLDDAGDNCPTVANIDQDNVDGDTLGDACDSDDDGDGVDDALDDCPSVLDVEQTDTDGDGLGDACDGDDDDDDVPDDEDVCPFTADPEQGDQNGDGEGDACDGDRDGDGEPNADDNCANVPNPGQENSDPDVDGDACDSDDDQDGVPDALDNCRVVANPGQETSDTDADGDACDADDDDDGDLDAADNCPTIANADQADSDGDSVGEACDDDDGDGDFNLNDNCRNLANPDQADADRDGLGDACDLDTDGDGIDDADDNCPTDSNGAQADSDGDDQGDACDSDIDGDGAPNATDNCDFVANDQADTDGDGTGDACDDDADGDTIPNAIDNCPAVDNDDQSDIDDDDQGDACDDDDDGDGDPDGADNCAFAPNADQADLDTDGRGDACDDDDDGDAFADGDDNCPRTANPSQADADQDGLGDACDP